MTVPLVKPDPPAYSVRFKRALAAYLAEHGAGTYRPEGAYAKDERGIITSGPMLPLTLDNCTVLTWLSPIPDGLHGMTYRVQILTRVKGTVDDAANYAQVIRDAVDHKQHVPPGFNISWSSIFSELAFGADANGRCSTAQTVHFIGRR